MKIDGEEVEQVRSFDELTPGVIVWMNPCVWCQSKVRGMIMSLDGRCGLLAGGGLDTRPAWLLTPSHKCQEHLADVAVGPTTVEEGRVFRVVNSSRDNKHRSKRKSGIRPQSVTSK